MNKKVFPPTEYYDLVLWTSTPSDGKIISPYNWKVIRLNDIGEHLTHQHFILLALDDPYWHPEISDDVKFIYSRRDKNLRPTVILRAVYYFKDYL